jgi:hypothetical protein
MATSTNGYDTHNTDKYRVLGLQRRHGSIHGFSLGSECMTRGQNTEDRRKSRDTQVGFSLPTGFSDVRGYAEGQTQRPASSGEGSKNERVTPSSPLFGFFSHNLDDNLAFH